MDKSTARVAALLHEAGETHHVVYLIVDGDDPRLGVVVRRLAARQLDKDHAAAGPDVAWPQWYAPRIVEHLGATGEPR